MNMGRILGLDPGTRRIGVAVSDALQMTAQPGPAIPTSEMISPNIATFLSVDIVEFLLTSSSKYETNPPTPTSKATLAQRIESSKTARDTKC